MKKKLFFIHVPKTAGSSFNAFLADNFKGEAHCEKYIDAASREFSSLDKIKEFEYISGHLNYSDFSANGFNRKDYFMMTFLRDPLKQLISHVNWVIHIFDVSEKFFKGHPKIIQDMTLELRSLDLNEPDQLIFALEKHAGLFQNNQAKYFRNEKNQVSTEAAIKNLSQLDFLGITEEYEDSVRTFIDKSNCSADFSLHKKNRNVNYRLKPDTLADNKQIKRFIEDYNGVDIEIYKFAKQRFSSLVKV